MAFTWVGSEIVTLFQQMVSEQSLASATCMNWINDYYQNQFPEDAQVPELKSWWTQTMSAVDNGAYSLAQTDLKILRPVYRDGENEVCFVHDHEKFFTEYPEQEQYITAPGLAIGTGDTTKVKHDAFSFRISGYGYEKASSEITLSGDTIPQNKYGAFCFKIDSDGDITVGEATNNSTGYDSIKDAVEDLAYSDSDTAYMGFVVVRSTDSGGFVPGTTDLSDSAVTDYYTDGKWESRGAPEAVTIFENKVYARPKANDIYQLKAPRLIRPTALTTGTAPTDKKWGPVLAIGAAIRYLTEYMGVMSGDKLDHLRTLYDNHMTSIRGKQIYQNTDRIIERSF